MENESKSNSINFEDNEPKTKNIELNPSKNSGTIRFIFFFKFFKNLLLIDDIT